MPDDGSCELKCVALCYVTLKCCDRWHIFVCLWYRKNTTGCIKIKLYWDVTLYCPVIQCHNPIDLTIHFIFNLIIVQQDVTYSVYYISVGSSTCFRCWHPSSGARKTVITALVLINRIYYHLLLLLSWNSTTRADGSRSS